MPKEAVTKPTAKPTTRKGTKPAKDAPASVKKPVAKLTTRQKKLVKGIVSGQTQKQAAISAGFSESYASQVLNVPKVKETLAEMMDKAGLSDDVLLAKHVELLNAKYDDRPDHTTQKGALEMAYKLKGAFVEKREITGANGGDISVKSKHELSREDLLAIAAGSSR